VGSGGGLEVWAPGGVTVEVFVLDFAGDAVAASVEEVVVGGDDESFSREGSEDGFVPVGDGGGGFVEGAGEDLGRGFQSERVGDVHKVVRFQPDAVDVDVEEPQLRPWTVEAA